MLKSVQIRNYRILNQLCLGDLHRINLIAGQNSCGKTALLEAIFFLVGAGNAHLFMNSNIIRGLIPSADIWARAESPWKEVFSNLDMLQEIEIVGEHEEFGELKLEITLERSLSEEIQFAQNGKGLISNHLDRQRKIRSPVSDILQVPVLNLRYFRDAALQAESKIRPNVQGVDISQPIANPPFNAIYVSSHTGSYEEDANRLGVLRRKRLGDILLKTLKVIEPRLQSVEESSATGVSMIYGDIGLDELVPLAVTGDGISRIARLILAISSVPGGVVIVDEIENGLHHTVLPNVWRAVNEATSTFNAQLISTTHSRESIEAAHDVLNGESFRLHRLESSGKTNRCVTYGPESIGAAIKHGLEVR